MGTAPATRRAAPLCLVEGSGALLQQLLKLTEVGVCVEEALRGMPTATADYHRSMVARVDEFAGRSKGKGGGKGGGAFVDVITAKEREGIVMISEMLPGCGEGFLVAVFRHYGGRTEAALNALLDGSLPPFLDAMPRDLAKPPPPLGAEEDEEPTTALSGRLPAAGGVSPVGVVPRRNETLAQRRARQQEAKVLSDLNAPGRRAPRSVLEAAAMDPAMAAALAAEVAATDAYSHGTFGRAEFDVGGAEFGVGGGPGGASYEAMLPRRESTALATALQNRQVALETALYEDELDDSLEAYSAEGRTAGPALQEDQEEASQAVRRGGQGGTSAAAVLFAHDPAEDAGWRSGEAPGTTPLSRQASSAAGPGAVSSGNGGGVAPLPGTALEWVRAIGLGQYVDAFRAAGIIRLELAARLSVADVARLKIKTEAHKTKLIQSAARLAERLAQRGRLPPPGSRVATEEVYAAAAQLHYDAETGEFWDEGGSMDAAVGDSVAAQGGGSAAGGGGGGGGGGGKGGGRPPLPVAVQRSRAEANKARLGNHSRKQGAARKQARAGAFSGM